MSSSCVVIAVLAATSRVVASSGATSSPVTLHIDANGAASSLSDVAKRSEEAVFVTDVVNKANPLCIQRKCGADLKSCAAEGECDKILKCGERVLSNISLTVAPDMHDCLRGLRLSSLTAPERKVFNCAKDNNCLELQAGASLIDVVGQVKLHGPGNLMRRAERASDESTDAANDVNSANSTATGQCPGDCAKVNGQCKAYRIEAVCNYNTGGPPECDSGSKCYHDSKSPNCPRKNGCGTVLCSYFGELGWLSETVVHGDIAFLALLNKPGRICHQGYLTWATHTVTYLKSLPEGHEDRTMLFFFVQHWAKTMAYIAGSAEGELSIMGLILLAVGMPPCFLLGLLPSLTLPWGYFVHMFITHVLARVCFSAPWILLVPVCWQVSRYCSNAQKKDM